MSLENKPVFKVLNFEVGEVDDDARTFWAVASVESRDRDGDIIRASGWDLANFMKNPVIAWAHDYGIPPVAKAIGAKIEDGRLRICMQFPTAEEYQFADTIYKLYRGGYLNAFSVGFSPLASQPLAEGGTDYLRQELYEVSCVTLPAHPEALREKALAGNLADLELRVANLAGALGAAPAQPDLVAKLADLEGQVVKLTTARAEDLARVAEVAALKAPPEPPPAEVAEPINPSTGPDEPEISPETRAFAAALLTKQLVKHLVQEQINYHLGRVA